MGSDASPNRLGKTGDADQTTAVGRVRRYKSGRTSERPRRSKLAHGVQRHLHRNPSPACRTSNAPRNMEIRCANTACDFTANRPLPILTVDEAIYRRLPAFLIATVDKFASLPWVAEPGAFFGQCRPLQDQASGSTALPSPGNGRPASATAGRLIRLISSSRTNCILFQGRLARSQDFTRLRIDQLASRRAGGKRVRPKIVASTATVRRAEAANRRAVRSSRRRSIFPPPGIDRTDSFLRTDSHFVAKIRRGSYVGIAAQGQGPEARLSSRAYDRC